MTFENYQINIDNITEIEHLDFKGLDSNQLVVDVIGSVIFSVLMIMGYYAVVIFADFELVSASRWVILLVLAFIIVVMLYVTIAGFRKKKYALRSHDIVYKNGLFWKSTTAIPFERVQHCEVKEGPIQRKFGLTTLAVYTAGGRSSDLNISGLPRLISENIRDFILHKSRISDEEE